MSLSIDDIVEKLNKKYRDRNNEDTWWATKGELERIIDSQYRFIYDMVDDKSLKEVHLIHLGIFRPSKFMSANRDRMYGKLSKYGDRYSKEEI